MYGRAVIGLAALLGAWVAASSDSGGGESGAAASPDAPAITRTVFMANLRGPWDMAFTPDGALLFTEKCRGLSVRRANGSVHRLFGTAGSAVVAADLFCEGQSGAHGVAMDPDFATNRYVYVFMASNRSTNPRTNRVVRMTVDAAYTTVANRTDILTDIAYKDAGNAVSGAGAHSGGRIRFGPDRYLYITTGDNHNPSLPQDLRRLGGKVLRVDRDGKAAPGNNTPAGGDPRIYTYGHRNVQGIAFRPGTGQPFACEHGPNHSDEVTPLVAGGNGGWDPQHRPGLTCPDNYCGYAGDAATMPMTDVNRFPNAMRPSWNNRGRSQGMGPCAFLSGAQWKAWDGRLAVGIMAAQRVDVLQLDTSGMATATTTMSLPWRRIRSIVQGPDGSLYLATDDASGAEIWRLTPN
jgi:glucose/arabinose dehydrogenase